MAVSNTFEAQKAGAVYFVNVVVGKFNQNADIAAELGVTLSKGIPVAVFFNPDLFSQYAHLPQVLALHLQEGFHDQASGFTDTFFQVV